MIKRITALGIVLSVFFNTSSAQETQPSVMEEISYVYMEKLVAVAKENYPRIKALNSKTEIAKASITNAKIGWLTPVSLSYVYSPTTTLNLSNPTFFNGYQLAFSFNLGAVLQTPVNIKLAKEELKITKHDYDEYMASLTTNVKTRYTSYLRALKALKLNSQASIDARDMFSLIKYKYERGEATLSDYVTASSIFQTSSQARIDSEISVLQAKFALEELLGIKLEEVPD